MTNRPLALFLLLVMRAPALAVPPIPPEQRFVAQVVAHLEAPADQPMHMPTAVAIDSHGVAFVADGSRDRIARFDADGKFAGYITQIAGQPLNRPVGVKFDPQDRLWIAETGNHRLLVVSADGSLIERIEPPADAAGKPCDPTDVAFSPDGKRLYVVDKDRQRILIRDTRDNQPRWTPMGSGGRALGQFEWPFTICIGAEGYVFIVESIGARVQLISPADRWAGTIGSWGIEVGQLYRPKGIVSDSQGRIYVGDSTLKVIQIFGPRGTVEGVLSQADGQPLRFEHPMGMCFDPRGRLFVVELRANRVAVVTFKTPDGASTQTSPNPEKKQP